MESKELSYYLCSASQRKRHENDSIPPVPPAASLPILYLELCWISIQLSTGGSTAIQIISLDREDVWLGNVLFHLCSFYNMDHKHKCKAKNTIGQFCFVPHPHSCWNNMQGL